MLLHLSIPRYLYAQPKLYIDADIISQPDIVWLKVNDQLILTHAGDFQSLYKRASKLRRQAYIPERSTVPALCFCHVKL